MGELFWKLLNMSITAGWMILAVMLARLLFKRMPKWIFCLMWGIVALRLICPFSPQSAIGLLPGAAPLSSKVVAGESTRRSVPSVSSPVRFVDDTVNPVLERGFSQAEEAGKVSLESLVMSCAYLWLAGILLMLLAAFISTLRLKKQLLEAVVYEENIYLCDGAKTPFILGVFRPRIYLPSWLNEREIAHVLAHERAHLKRLDHFWKPAGYLLLCIYWFNPLCWAAYILFCRDIELACDEKVVRDMELADKKAYSKTLLACSVDRRLIMVCPLAFGEVGIKHRIKSVLDYKKPAFWMVSVVVALCIIISVCFFTTSPNRQENPNGVAQL